MTATTLAHGAASSVRDEDIAYARVTWRLLPLLFICYVAAYLDRVNVGFAKLQMLNDLKFSESIYGLGGSRQAWSSGARSWSRSLSAARRRARARVEGERRGRGARPQPAA